VKPSFIEGKKQNQNGWEENYVSQILIVWYVDVGARCLISGRLVDAGRGIIAAYCALRQQWAGDTGPHISIGAMHNAQGFTIDFNHFTIEHVASDASATSAGVTIQSIETTLNLLDASDTQVDFIDFAFSPYANVAAGGQNATFGGINTPSDLTIFKSTLANDPIAIGTGDPVVSVQFQLQIFVTNTTASSQVAFGTLRVIADF
jgi:hypothetical protein